MAETTRTFVAIPLPHGVIAKLERFQSQLAPAVAGVRWARAETMHLTLAFLGDVKNSDLARVSNAVGSAALASAPFALRVEGLGAFPDAGRPKILWAGLTGDGCTALLALQKGIAHALENLGYPPDDRFHPHITLGRLKPGRSGPLDLRPRIEQHRHWSAGGFTVNEVVTYSSLTSPEGPVYAALATAGLGTGKASPPA